MSNVKTTSQIYIKDGKELNRIYDILRSTSGVDFLHYKQNTIKRRIQRRLSMHKLSSLDDYLLFIQKNRTEADALYNDLLINVTSFFRDAPVFVYLKNKIFPHITRDKSLDNPIRIWVPGCATGEEVYSIAMCLIEFLEDPARKVSASVQVFGTDISDDTIEKARTGIYEKDIEKDVSKDRLERFFTKLDSNHYQINKAVREICVFAKQNIVNDPPFSNLDLISCRNLLIYLESFMQKRIIPVFHYALKQHGYLLLGNSETIGEFTDLFQVEDKRNKIYSKKSLITPNHLQFYGTNFSRTKITKQKKPSITEEETARLATIQQEVDKIISNRYAPSGVVVNNSLDIIHFKGSTSRYLEPSPGKASLNLLKMAKEGMFLVLNSAIKQARKDGKAVRKDNVQFMQEGQTQFLSIEVIPIKGTVDSETNFLILFEDSKLLTKNGNGKTAYERLADSADGDQQAYLKQELAATREYLQSAIAELESTNEELQVANEEILSNNEELQSVNEELETSKEELQSANEELITLNEELQIRNDQVRQINNDLNNLLMSVNIPIIMLDKELYIRRFTPGAEKVMNLIHSDIGRPIGNIRPNIIINDLEALLFDAIHRDLIKEIEIQDKQGKWYLMRVLPYKTAFNQTEGAILAFIDVDTLKKNEVELAKASAIVDSSDDAIISKSKDGIILSWNKGAQRLYGYTPEEIIGKPITTIMPPNKKNDFPMMMKQLLDGKKIEHYETQRMTKDGRILDVSLTVSPLKDTNGNIVGASKIARDITQRKNAEENLRFLSYASAVLASSLDYQTTLANVVKLAVPNIADWCTIETLNEDGELDLLAIAHKDPKKIEWAKKLRQERPVDMNAPTGTPNVLRTGKAEFYPIITEEMLKATAKTEADFQLVKDIGFTSAIIVPIFANNKPIGALSFVTTESRKRYTKEDLAMAEQLGNRISLAMEHASLYKQAQESIALRDQFISVASHELRTPVTSLKTYAHVLGNRLNKCTLEENTVLPLKKMNEQLNKLEMLIKDLLSVSRLQHGKMEFTMDAFDLSALIKETVDVMQQTTKKHTIIVKGESKKPVFGDIYRIGQVIVNVLSNAIKYSPAADKAIVTISSNKHEAIVSVQDFGIGIEKKHHSKIFDQFYRVSSFEERTYPGLGMGLYISHEIIKRHGGKMSIASEKGKGTTITFTIPYKN